MRWESSHALGVVVAICAGLGCESQAAPTPADAPAQTPTSIAENFCSLDGIMKLVPQTIGPDGKFQIPDPGTNLPEYLEVHQALSRLIDMAITRAEMSQDPSEVAENPHGRLGFSPDWRSAEVGIGTDGKTLSFPDGEHFASFGGKSFLTGIVAAPGTGETMYQVKDGKGGITALVMPQPTALPCVNRLVLAAANTGGTWMPPTFALGPEGGDAFLIVDLCVDLAAPVSDPVGTRLAPNAELFIAIQWADTEELSHLRTDQKAHNHGGH